MGRSERRAALGFVLLLSLVGCDGDPVTQESPGFTISTASDPAVGGTTDGGGTYPPGVPVTVTASPADGYTFLHWTLDGEQVSERPEYTFPAEADRGLVAAFEVELLPLLVTAAGTGTGTIVSAPSGIECQVLAGGTAGSCVANFPWGTTLTLSVTVAEGQRFTGWSGVCEGSGSCQVSVTGERRLIAGFEPEFRTLTVAASGSGTVTSFPAGIDCAFESGDEFGECSADFPWGTRVTLEASSTAGQTFTGWSGPCTGAGVCAVTMTTSGSVSAVFAPIQYAIVTGSTPSDGGTTSGGGRYDAGTEITVTATPRSGYTFVGWTEGGEQVTASSAYTFTADRARNLVATFAEEAFTLLINGSGRGRGTVTSSPAGIRCALTSGLPGGDCSAVFPVGAEVTLSASGSEGHSFDGWLGSCSGTGPCSVVMNGDRSVTATFTGSPPPIAGDAPFAGKRILWVGAHPDDEVLTAPILAEACLHAGATCTLLVTTRGGAACRYQPPPGLTCAEARAGEMVQAARLLGSALIQWDLPNGSHTGSPSAALSAWSRAAGSEQALVTSMRSAIDAVNPEVIVTFDPRHGDTCHPEHRLVSTLVLRALEGRSSGQAPILRWRAAQYPTEDFDQVIVREQGGTLYVLDGNRPAPGGGTYWSYIASTVRVHRTQFGPEDVARVERTPVSQRLLYLLDPGPNPPVSGSYC